MAYSFLFLFFPLFYNFLVGTSVSVHGRDKDNEKNQTRGNYNLTETEETLSLIICTRPFFFVEVNFCI